VRKRLLLAAVVALTTGALIAGCGAQGNDFESADTVTGKRLFTEKCGGCHVLADAGTNGQIGPNLDNGLGYAKEQGFEESTLYEVVREQIEIPNENGQMPANLVTGNDAVDVAAYVAEAVKPEGAGK
jgi:mono/diheme cytochrome c family protein